VESVERLSMEKARDSLEMYQNKRVLVTGHTGFKGSWLTLWLREVGAQVIGVSIDGGAPEGVFQLANLKEKIIHLFDDINNFEQMRNIFHLSFPISHFGIIPHLRVFLQPRFDRRQLE